MVSKVLVDPIGRLQRGELFCVRRPAGECSSRRPQAGRCCCQDHLRPGTPVQADSVESVGGQELDGRRRELLLGLLRRPRRTLPDGIQPPMEINVFTPGFYSFSLPAD